MQSMRLGKINTATATWIDNNQSLILSQYIAEQAKYASTWKCPVARGHNTRKVFGAFASFAR